MSLPPFILASASSARRRLLQNAGIDPLVCPSHFDEDQIQSSDPALLVKTLAIRKADLVATKLAPQVTVPTLVIGATYDTMDPKHMEWMSMQVKKGRFLLCLNGSHRSQFDDQETYLGGVIRFVKDVDAGKY